MCVCVGVGPSEAAIPTPVATLIRRFGIDITQNPQYAHKVQLKQSTHVPTHSAPLFLREANFSLFSDVFAIHSVTFSLPSLLTSSHRTREPVCPR